MLMRLTLVFAAALLAGCAQRPVGAPAPRVDVPQDRQIGVSDNGVVIRNTAADGARATVIRAPLNRVWPALRAAYADAGVTVTVEDTVGHQLGNGQFAFRRSLGGQPASRYFDCGLGLTGPRADDGQIRSVIVTRLTDANDGTTLMSTTVHGAVQSASGTTSSRIDCSSTGRLEARFEEYVASHSGG